MTAQSAFFQYFAGVGGSRIDLLHYLLVRQSLNKFEYTEILEVSLVVNRVLKSPDAQLKLNPYIQDIMLAKAEQLIQLCKQHRVLSLELFGSATNDRFNPSTSDLDFLVEFINQNPEGASTRFFGLRKGLAELFNKTVDLVEINQIQNPYFLEAIAPTRVMIYGA